MKATLLLLLGCLCLQASAENRASGSAFELGKRQYETGNYARALDLFSKAIASSSDSTLKNKAYYYQGLVLHELGYHYASYLSFRNVLMTADDKAKEIYEKAIKNAVVITDRMEMVDRVGKSLERLPQNFIPTSVTAYANYAMGVASFMAGDNSLAESRLKSVNPENQFYLKSLFILGIISTKQKNYKEAHFYFQKVIDMTRGRRDLFAIQELARLNLARTVYTEGDMERSVELYSQFLSSSPHWLTILHEASWPLMRVNDTTVSLGNLQTVLSPFYREDLVGEAYILRATVLFSLCKYEEMRQTLSQFFTLYDPVTRAMQNENTNLGSPESYFRAFVTGKGINRAFINYARRDTGVMNELRTIDSLRIERINLAKFGHNESIQHIITVVKETETSRTNELGLTLQRLHKHKLAELIEQREQANYLKVEIVTGEKELIEGQKGLPPKRLVDVETSVAAGYHFWPFTGEYWEDELGAYVYTTESSCVN